MTLARSRRIAPAMNMSAALCFEGRVAEELRSAGVTTSILGPVRLRRLDWIWRARRALARRLRDDRVDVAICHQAWPLAIFGSVVKDAGVRLVSWVHMAQCGRHWVERLAQRIEPDLIVCNSRFTASTLRPTTTRVAIVYPPVLPSDGANVRAKSEIRHDLSTPSDDVVITQVSRMEAAKGHEVCHGALAQLRDQPGWTCWQVGGAQRPGEQRYLDSLRKRADRLGITSRIRFTGARADARDLLRASDIFCQPNLGPEGFGLTFVEALSAGLPVVTSAIGGALEIVDPTCGVVVAAGDASALSAALHRLLTDGHTRARLQQGGPTRARQLCDPAVQMPTIERLMATV